MAGESHVDGFSVWAGQASRARPLVGGRSWTESERRDVLPLCCPHAQGFTFPQSPCVFGGVVYKSHFCGILVQVFLSHHTLVTRQSLCTLSLFACPFPGHLFFRAPQLGTWGGRVQREGRVPSLFCLSLCLTHSPCSHVSGPRLSQFCPSLGAESCLLLPSAPIAASFHHVLWTSVLGTLPLAG